MSVRFRIGPFTFGKTGVRLSVWRRGSGVSVPLFNKKARSFGKVKVGGMSYYLPSKSKKGKSKQITSSEIEKIKENHPNAYEPWTIDEDEKLVALFREGKSVQELSQLFGRTKGAIRARINRLLLE